MIEKKTTREIWWIRWWTRRGRSRRRIRRQSSTERWYVFHSNDWLSCLVLNRCKRK